jgi:hypothetical protein
MDPLLLHGGNENGEKHKRGLTGDLLGEFHDPNISLGEIVVKRHAGIMHEVQDLILIETPETPEHPLWQRTKDPFLVLGCRIASHANLRQLGVPCFKP